MVKQKGGIDSITLSLSNLFNFFSFLTPFLTVFFLVMVSIFNMDLKGFIYLGGILMVSIINELLMNIVKSPVNDNRNPLCGALSIPFSTANSRYNSPSLNSVIISFTFAYLFLPMIFNNQLNYAVVVAFTSIFIIDTFSQISNKCTNGAGVILGGLVGIIFGSIFYTLIFYSGYKNLLFFQEFQSNNIICKRPKKQQFKCKVYKNGELVDSTVA